MKLTQKQLRTLILAETRKLDESLDSDPDPVAAATNVAVAAIVDDLYNHSGVETLSRNAFEMLADTFGEDIPTLVRYEDVESAATQATEAVLVDPRLRDLVQQLCESILRGMVH